MGNKKHIIITFALSTIIIFGLAMYAGSKNNSNQELLLDDNQDVVTIDGPLNQEEQLIANADITNTMNPTAIIKTNQGVIKLELFADQMPITVGNFISLAESGFYNETKFHRVIKGFMIQGGDPNTKSDNENTYGTGGSENIQDEFVEGELLTNTRGTIAMANIGQPNSGSSQFFINLADNTNLDFNKQPFSSKHPVFGRVVEGMDTVDTIAAEETKAKDIPLKPIVIESITIENN